MADGRVIIDTEVDSSGAEKDVGKLGNKLTKVGSTMAKGVGVALKGTAVAIGTTATAIGALGAQSVKLYSEYEQLVGGVDTLFKESSKQVQKYAENAYKTAGISANKYMDTVTSFSASLISSVGGDTKKAADLANVALTDMSDNANKMGTSMDTVIETYQSLAKGNYAMLDNLKLGYGGTKSEMERLIKDAAKLDKSVDANSMSYGNMVKAIHAVQTQMGITGTTAKEASTTIQGSIGMMSAAWDNFLTGMADPNQDFDALVGNLIDSVVTVGENLIPRIQGMLPQLVNGLTQLLNSLIPMIPPIIQQLLPALINGAITLLNGLIAMAPQMLPIIANLGMQLIMQLVTSILAMLPQILDLGLQLIGQLVLGLAQATPQVIDAIIECVFGLIDAIIENLPMLVEAGLELVIALAEGLVEAIPNIVEKIPILIENLLSKITELLPKIIEAGIELFTSLVEQMPVIITSICDAIPKIIDAIVSNIESLVPLIIDAGVKLFVALVKNLPLIIATSCEATGKIIASILTALMDAVPRFHKAGYDLLVGILGKIGEACIWIGGKMKSVVNAIKNAITNKISEFASIGKNIVNGLWNGILSMKDTITKNVSNFFSGIVNSAKEKLGIHSPSKVFYEIGNFLVQGAINGISSMLNDAKNMAETLGQTIYQAANDQLAKNPLSVKGSFYDEAQLNKQIKDISVNNASLMKQVAFSQASSSGMSGVNVEQVINVNQSVSTPDELARAMRLEARYNPALGLI